MTDESFGIIDGRMQFTVLWSEDASVGIFARDSWTATPWMKVDDVTIINHTGLFVDPTSASQSSMYYQVLIE
jgi:hypothetical protein